MFRLAALFLCIALVAAFYGFAGVADYSWEGARILVYIFLTLSAITFLGGWLNRPTPV